MHESMKPPGVVYIGGCGRNGSTWLGLCLERSPDVCFAGELTHLWQRGFLDDERCGCRRPFSRYDFWHAVTQEAFGTFSRSDAGHLCELRGAISAFRRLPWVLAGRPHVSPRILNEYGAAYRQWIGAIARVAQARVIVDSSKYPTDLAALLRYGAAPIKIVHLVRNCNAVVHSWKRKKRRTEIHWKAQDMPRYNAVTTALGWKAFNCAIARLARQYMSPCCLVRYEDLVDSFPGTLGELFAWIGVDQQPAVAVRPSHSMAGNPCRLNADPLRVERDEEWLVRPGAVDRLIVKLLCGREQRHYGYSGVAASPGELQSFVPLIRCPAQANDPAV